ncbi:type I-E CRISPR-associated protein Cas6/Cse3/CasE [Streptomyces sp. NPDC050423]|uniref:type I-E CRISPR-associated protein Cas6/Cse3/CasE n=1 Tax=Streptomyces sp. NPDC050423 TaxID=3155402 RepID=UPI00343D1D74
MSGFPGWVDDGSPDPRAQMGILSTWTVDLKQACLNLVVRSSVPADWSGVPRAALADRPEVLTVDRTFRSGDRGDFRTVVNPMRNLRPAPGSPHRTPGVRVPHTRPEHVKKRTLGLSHGCGPSRRAHGRRAPRAARAAERLKSRTAQGSAHRACGSRARSP